MHRPIIRRFAALLLLGVVSLSGCLPSSAGIAEGDNAPQHDEVARSPGANATAAEVSHGEKAPAGSKSKAKIGGEPRVGDATPKKSDRIKATNLVQLKARLGQVVTAYGRVERIGSSSSGHRFVNFVGGQLSAICRKEHVAAFKGSQSLDKFRGKDIELSGKLKEYKGKLQIELSKPSQIRLATATVAAAPRAELKKIGKNAWISPLGLQYKGLDPQGKTRVDHIMRHAQNDPTRSGPHGVFDPGDKEVVFGLIDEAWRIAQAKKLRPNREGARSTFTVQFPKRIGYLGGQSGARQGRPALKRVFIVFEAGTKNIITAFPK